MLSNWLARVAKDCNHSRDGSRISEGWVGGGGGGGGGGGEANGNAWSRQGRGCRNFCHYIVA